MDLNSNCFNFITKIIILILIGFRDPTKDVKNTHKGGGNYPH
jgi:hypothetical protein